MSGSDVISCEMREYIKKLVDEKIDKRLEGIRTMIESTLNEYLVSVGKSTISVANKKVLQRGGSRQSAVASTKLSNFGQENYGYLLMPYLSTQLKTSHDMHSLLQKIVTDLYFNPERKSNHILYIPPNTYKAITVYIDGAWKNFDLSTTLEKIVRRANDVLQHYLVGAEEDEERRFKQEIGNKKFDMIRDFTDKIDNMEEDPEFQSKLISDTERTIITNQHIIHKHIYDTPEDINSS